MGGGRGGGYGNDAATQQLRSNLQRLTEHFRVSPHGNFGHRSPRGNTRRIASSDPASSAEQFFRIASHGADRLFIEGDGFMRAEFADGSNVVWRRTSRSDGTPAVRLDLANSSYGVQPVQRIHFVKE